MLNEIDIYGLLAIQARRVLNKYLHTLPNGISEVIVFRGYYHGNALQSSFIRSIHINDVCVSW